MAWNTQVRRLLVGLVAVGLLVAGCSGGSDGSGRSTARDVGASASPSGRAASTVPARTGGDKPSESPTETPEPTLPPGDPGADAPGVDDPNAEPTEAAAPPAERPRRAVPVEALLDAVTVGSITATTWALTAAPEDSCSAPRLGGAVAQRTAALRGDTGDRLVETVTTHRDADAATAAIRALGRRLAGCRGASPSDPRIGEASVQATVTSADGTSTLVTAIAAEGVTAVLSGTGAVAGEDLWPSLTDLALGNTCAAAPDGCH